MVYVDLSDSLSPALSRWEREYSLLSADKRGRHPTPGGAEPAAPGRGPGGLGQSAADHPDPGPDPHRALSPHRV